MPEINPEFNPEIKPSMPPKAGPEVYRAWSTKAEKDENPDYVQEHVTPSPAIPIPTAQIEQTPVVSDRVLEYIEELKHSKDPVVTLNQWMADVKSGAKTAFDVAEAMAAKDGPPPTIH